MRFMCGIFTAYNLKGVTSKALEIVNHRGPDYQDLVRVDDLYLGHTRLAIIDLDKRANQPLKDESERYWIVFNGEIYNYLELKEELKSLGQRFRTSSDTEVLLKSYIQWGKDCLDKLNGMFSFVIYDKQEKTVFMARDRFGIKPLYIYQKEPGSFAVASEIKQFTVLPGFKAEANLPRVIDFISWRLVNHTHQTLFKNVYQLSGGEYIELKLGKERIEPMKEKKEWYSYKRLRDLPALEVSEERAYRQFRELLKDSVRLRLRADTPISVCLSGGLDSSSISCLIDSLENRGQNLFSACNHNQRFDEFKYAKSVIDRVKTQNFHKVFLEKESIFERIRKDIWYNDEPVVTIGVKARSNLCREIHKEGFKVTISGEGGDEVLGVYGNYAPFIAELAKKGKIKHAFSELWAIGKIRSKNLFFRFAKMAKVMLDAISGSWDNNQFVDIYKGKKGNHEERNPRYRIKKEKGLKSGRKLRDFNILLLKFTSLPMLLQYEDRTSMNYSVEGRVPYLDHRVVEFVMRLPLEYKIKKGKIKNVLRESMKDLLPPEIYNRDSKMGFAVPQNPWAEEDLRESFRMRVLRAARRHSIFDEKEIKKLLDKDKSPRTVSLFWRIIFFDMWAEQYKIKL